MLAHRPDTGGGALAVSRDRTRPPGECPRITGKFVNDYDWIPRAYVSCGKTASATGAAPVDSTDDGSVIARRHALAMAGSAPEQACGPRGGAPGRGRPPVRRVDVLDRARSLKASRRRGWGVRAST